VAELLRYESVRRTEVSKIFDLSKVKRFVDERHPKAIAIVDTNVIMNDPDFAKWDSGTNEVLFVLSSINLRELEHLKKRTKSNEKQDDLIIKVIAAIRSFTELFNRGEICRGIRLEQTGWFISVPMPDIKELEEALSELQPAAEAWGKSDIELFILARELGEEAKVPVFFMTGDKNLCNFVKVEGMPAYLCESFPINIREFISDLALRKVDWEQILREIQSEAKDALAEVELTLTKKSVMTDTSNADELTVDAQFAIAEGVGTLTCKSVGSEMFYWHLRFSLYDLNTFDFSSEEIDPIDSVDIRFANSGVLVPDQLIRNLKQSIAACASPNIASQDMPTVQEIGSMLQIMASSDDLIDSVPRPEDVDKTKQDIKKAGDLVDYWFKRLSEPKPWPEEMPEDTLLARFVLALDRCWMLGKTIRFQVLVDRPRPSPSVPDWLQDLLHGD
jgi:hypothetical protein